MAQTEMVRMAKFIDAKTTFGMVIMANPHYARYRRWLGVKLQVDISTAEFSPNSSPDTRVKITLPWGDTEIVRSVHITGLTAEDRETMYRIALDKRYPTSRMSTAIKNGEEVAPPA